MRMGGGAEDMDGLLTSDPIASSCKKRLNPDKKKRVTKILERRNTYLASEGRP